MSSIRRIGIHSVPPRIVALTALASYTAQVFAVMQGWPLWGIALAMLLPWLPIFTLETAWTYHHYHWLALFYVLVITQGGHVVEHLAQMIQIHVLGLTGLVARGVFGALDIEWVHFTWNTWVLIAVVLLVPRFRGNPWLWVTAALAGWHEVEHVAIMSVYLRTGVAGTPGLLSRGGLIGGGLPLSRADLHFLYNLVETIPLVIGFVYQLRHAYDEWLKRALPHLPEPLLTVATERLAAVRFGAGETILRQGEVSDRFYVITQGDVEVTRRDPSGRDAIVDTLVPGQYFGEIGLLTGAPRNATVRAKTTVELLVVDQGTFRTLIESSRATADDLVAVARQRQGRAGT